MTNAFWLRIGAVLGFLAVATGAFGAHWLKGRLVGLGTVETFETGAKYHMYHALALLAVGLIPRSGGLLSVAGWSFLAGILIFSGSLYVLSLTGMKWLGAITPIGGVLLLVGWAALAMAADVGKYASTLTDEPPL